MRKNKIIDFVGIVLLAVSVLFLVRRMVAVDVNFADLLTPINVAMIVVMPFVSVIVIFLYSYCWRMNLKLFINGNISPSGDVFLIYARANIMKYLPGNVGHYAGRQLFGIKMGMKQVEIAAASLLEIVYNATAMILCALIFSAQTVVEELKHWTANRNFVWIIIFVFIILSFGSAAVYCFRKNQYVIVILGLLRSLAFWRVFLLSILLWSFGTLVNIMGYVILIGQYVTLDFSKMVILLAANYIAVFIGFVTPGVPGGVGVREAVLMGILAPFFPENTIVLAAIIHRIILILGDLLAVPLNHILYSRAS